MPEMSTTGNSNFPVIDITHKPKRLQRDNIMQAGTAYNADNPDTSVGDPLSCIPLHNVTIERAIQYYEANATGELTTLYSNTAKWLRQLLAVGMNAVAKAVKESEERANEKTPEISEGEQT